MNLADAEETAAGVAARARQKRTDHCIVCFRALPAARLPLRCSSCGSGLHPSCAGRVERGVNWGDRRLVCPACALEDGEDEKAIR